MIQVAGEPVHKQLNQEAFQLANIPVEGTDNSTATLIRTVGELATYVCSYAWLKMPRCANSCMPCGTFFFLQGENGISFVSASLFTRFHWIATEKQKPLKMVTMAKPTSAFLRAGPSLVPSPVTATTCRVSPTVLSMIPEQGETKQMFSVRAEMNKGFPVVRPEHHTVRCSVANAAYVTANPFEGTHLWRECAYLWVRTEPEHAVWARPCPGVLAPPKDERQPLILTGLSWNAPSVATLTPAAFSIRR